MLDLSRGDIGLDGTATEKDVRSGGTRQVVQLNVPHRLSDLDTPKRYTACGAKQRPIWIDVGISDTIPVSS